MNQKVPSSWLLALLIVISLGCSLQAGLPLESAGVRFGFPANDDLAFRQVEVFTDFKLPLLLELSTNWLAQTRLDVSAGWLGKHSVNAFVGTLGPSVILSRRDFPVSLDAGFNPTILSRYKFYTTSFGMPVQFTSHVGVAWDVNSRIRLGYRFQHMSNGGLNEPNPGLNLHLFTVSCRF